jgi:hypothetical protein
MKEPSMKWHYREMGSRNKKTGKLHIFIDWNAKVNPGDYLCFEAIRVVDPETYSKIYSDTWLKKYVTALFKKQWGSNLTKYANYTLPGGLVVNGEKIYNDAETEVEALEVMLRDTYEMPVAMLVG